MQKALAFYRMGTWIQAERICSGILRAHPRHFDALNMLGSIAAQSRRTEEAAGLLKRAVQARPNDAGAHNNYGNVLKDLERHEDALRSFERALRLRPVFAEAHVNRGNALLALFRCEEALASYDVATRISPSFAEAWFNRGNALSELQRLQEALASYERALAINSRLAGAWAGHGNALLALDRCDGALASYERVLALDPSHPWAYGTWLYARMRLCDWRGWDEQMAEVDARIGQAKAATTPFIVLALRDSPALQRRAAEVCVRETASLRQAPLPSVNRPAGERIRLAYYSPDFYRHATAHLAAELFELHDRDKFEVLALSFGPDHHDEMRERLIAAFDRFVDVRGRSDGEIAQLSRDLGIDIAVDLKGFTMGHRSGIFSRRAAPVQVSYLGYPGTMSAPYIDYLIADRTVVPDPSRRHYAEQIVYLPFSYQVNDSKRPVAEMTVDRAALGLPRRGVVFCCFNAAYKIAPDLFGSWMRILQGVEGSVLWLLEDIPAAAANLRREAQQRGVDAKRLVFAPRLPVAAHLARHAAADLFLDTFPYNAHTTASDALWAGVPVLTQIGESFAGRVAASLLNAVGLPELITDRPAQYESRAIELATRPDRLTAVRETLRRNRCTAPLFDTRSYVRHLEDAYEQMYRRYHARSSPGPIYVSA
ncbi:MAG TPA: tetratricopeptide repeat protein [Steroidobacteraceae bacterium]|nr:tetratricopeptide repeat protein [Steroidobacteraceae bacterium]